MLLTSLRGNSQMLDGGAMFGNAPKAVWQKWIEADEYNRIPLGCRALLIQSEGKNILLETGIGNFFEPKLKTRYGVVEDEHCLLESLRIHGLSHEEIDAVILSHLHFDHAGGLLTAWEEGKAAELLFPKAQFIVGEVAFERAKKPHPRDKASFIPELPTLLEASGRLELVSGRHSTKLDDTISFRYSDGHTPGMLLTEIAHPNGPIVFCADLIPALPWVHVPITMGYDRFPEKLIDEKQSLLDYIVDKEGFLFFTHDVKHAMARIERDDLGRFKPKDAQAELVNWS